ncbi:substrate-binding periplasmic protein [Magnetospirillum sulfuroxidans]|uniref:Transporter substrate-binding domain-containing protein n=1 Tax=Magnetospirillum sulfuroxidans TaxID=611300 RepID=A0ABS5IAG5_9PROT|nr:transporter substrate-binding domain-containing protein [Magnetospirillum sulfuroxidans]MBR9971405.1 transporter substrate-binding domain-containing protein [Magnetospirillum sulfuroxidans]
MKNAAMQIVGAGVAAMLACGGAQARDITVAVPRSVPPYVIADGWRGIEYDVVRQSLAKVGLTMVPKLTVLARVPKEMQSNDVEAALTMQPGTGVAACYSQSHVTYHNYVITLAKDDLRIDSVADLADKSVVAFQNAHIYLGEDYARATNTAASYREEANQAVQALLLYSGRVQAVVADDNIFRWFAGQTDVRSRVDVTQKLRLHEVFPPTPYQVAFRDPALCARFNDGLAQLRASGEFDRIVNSYLSQMESNLAQSSR